MADAAILFADRMKHFLAEEKPSWTRTDPAHVLAALAVDSRSIESELDLIASIRRHLASILEPLPQAKTERLGIHSTDDPLSPRPVP